MKYYTDLTTNKGWYSLDKILSYGRHLMIITGKRSTGKSTGVALYLLLDYLQNGHGWIYTRRTQDETDLTAPDWFDNAAEILTLAGIPAEVTYEKGKYKVNGEEAGFAIALSQQQKYKGKNLSLAYWIVYDEFISFDGRYLGTKADPEKEYRSLMSMYQTADRGIGKSQRNETRIIALGNNDTYYNPLYMALGIDRYIRADTHFLAPKGEEWVVQQLRPEDAENAEEYRESVGYKLSDERTKQYAYENMSKEEAADKSFIRRVSAPMVAACNLIFDGVEMGVYCNYNDGYLYISSQKNGGQTYALTAKDHKPNYFLLQSGSPQIKQVKFCYSQGKIVFENMRVKMALDNFFKFVV